MNQIETSLSLNRGDFIHHKHAFLITDSVETSLHQIARTRT